MIKLLTLKNVSPYAEDALFKICLNLDKFTLTEDTDYENYEELLNGAKESLQNGEHIIVAVDTADYNMVKETFNCSRNKRGAYCLRYRKSRGQGNSYRA